MSTNSQSFVRLAIPASADTGLDAALSQHFGRCPYFALVRCTTESIIDFEMMTNPKHLGGGCLAPIEALHRQSVDIILVKGVGARPLAGLQRAGIRVLHVPEPGTVQHAIKLWQKSKLRNLGPSAICVGRPVHPERDLH